MESTNDLVDVIISYNSSEKNAICCIEEMSELTKVITKNLRKSPKFNTDDLLEEISHVLLMCNVIAKEHNLSDDDILKIQQDAVERMKEDYEKEHGNPRVCSHCGKKMNKGFCVDDGLEYYCCRECLLQHYNEVTYTKMCDSERIYYSYWY